MRFANQYRPGFARFAPMPPTSAARWNTSSALGIAEHAGGVVHRREVVVGAAGDDDFVTVGLEALTRCDPRNPPPPVTSTRIECRLQVASGTGAADAGLAGCPVRLSAWPASRSPSVSKCSGADSAYRNCGVGRDLSFCSPSSPSTTRSRTPRSAGTTRRSTSRMRAASPTTACCRRTAWAPTTPRRGTWRSLDSWAVSAGRSTCRTRTILASS